jgi:circadian clock protein KaiB
VSDPSPFYLFRLFIAGDAPHSSIALKNLRAFCIEHLNDGGYRIEVVDVLTNPSEALANRIFVTPTVARQSPGPLRRVIGDLSDRDALLRLIGAGNANSS